MTDVGSGGFLGCCASKDELSSGWAIVQPTDGGEPGNDDILESPYVLSSMSSVAGSGYSRPSTMSMAKPSLRHLSQGLPVTDPLVEVESTTVLNGCQQKMGGSGHALAA